MGWFKDTLKAGLSSVARNGAFVGVAYVAGHALNYATGGRVGFDLNPILTNAIKEGDVKSAIAEVLTMTTTAVLASAVAVGAVALVTATAPVTVPAAVVTGIGFVAALGAAYLTGKVVDNPVRDFMHGVVGGVSRIIERATGQVDESNVIDPKTKLAVDARSPVQTLAEVKKAEPASYPAAIDQVTKTISADGAKPVAVGLIDAAAKAPDTAVKADTTKQAEVTKGAPDVSVKPVGEALPEGKSADEKTKVAAAQTPASLQAAF